MQGPETSLWSEELELNAYNGQRGLLNVNRIKCNRIRIRGDKNNLERIEIVFYKVLKDNNVCMPSS